MDNLTHTLTGVMLARAGLNRFVPRATLLLAIAANAPDVDIVSWFGGPLTYLRYHRGWTHTCLLLPVMALLPALLVFFLERARTIRDTCPGGQTAKSAALKAVRSREHCGFDSRPGYPRAPPPGLRWWSRGPGRPPPEGPSAGRTNVLL